MNTPLVILAVIWALSALFYIVKFITDIAKENNDEAAKGVIVIFFTAVLHALLYSAGLWTLW